jgi:predicted metal-dependent HD superfamily phosphohydrolase
MFEELENVKNDIDDLDSFKLSVFYHDIIYDATANDNEKQSAILMQKHLSKTSFTNIQKCSEQIEATKRHEKSSHLDTNYLLDIDLAILGENESVYENYCNQIRNEYKMYSNRQYYHGRILVLQNLLSSDTIFKTAYFRNIYEKRAKNNLQNEILLLNKKMKKLS